MSVPSYKPRSYPGNAVATTLTSSLQTTDYTINVASTVGWVDTTGAALGVNGPFVIAVNYGTSTEEKILCQSLSGSTITVYSDGVLATAGRGYDGTVAGTFGPNTVVVPVWSALEAAEANLAVSETIGTATVFGDMLYTIGAQNFTRLAIGSTNNVLSVVSGVPKWQALTTSQLPAIPVSGLAGTGSTSGQVLVATGSGTAPGWQTRIGVGAGPSVPAMFAYTTTTSASNGGSLTMVAQTTAGGTYAPTIVSGAIQINYTGFYQVCYQLTLIGTGSPAVYPLTSAQLAIGSTSFSGAWNSQPLGSISTVNVVYPISSGTTITAKVGTNTNPSNVSNGTSGNTFLSVAYLGPSS